ncbi:MAG: AEC family transporter [Pseudomonadota bacterium]
MLVMLLLPLILLAAAGCLLARINWLKEGWHHGLAEITSKFLLPAFLFTGAYKNGLPASVSWQIMAAFYVPMVALFAVAAWGLRRQPGSALAASYSNNVFVGIPVLVAAFGETSLQFAYPIIAFHTLLNFLLYFLAQGGAHIGRALLSALTHPIVVSLMAGLAMNLLNRAVPTPIAKALGMLAATALPCALLALGASLAKLKLQSAAAGAGVAAVKLLVLPAAVLACASALAIPAAALPVLVLMSACPVGVNAGTLVQAEGKDPGVVNSAILLSSVACIVTIPMWLWIVGAA